MSYIIRHHGKCNISDVVRYMKGEEDSKEFREIFENFGTSDVTTKTIIKDLIKDGRVIVLRGSKKGQSHVLGYDPNNRVNNALADIADINKQFSELPDPTMIRNELEAIKMYDKVWSRDIKGFEDHLKFLLIMTKTNANVFDEAGVHMLRIKIANSWSDLATKDREVRTKIRHLKEYLKFKSKSKSKSKSKT